MGFTVRVAFNVLGGRGFRVWGYPCVFLKLKAGALSLSQQSTRDPLVRFQISLGRVFRDTFGFAFGSYLLLES